MGFLDFYSRQFDYKSHVVSIRQLKRMSKFEKLWNSDTFAIEDPFDLKRNLGGALSKKSKLLGCFSSMYTFLVKSDERPQVADQYGIPN